jgi:hypothetical protein
MRNALSFHYKSLPVIHVWGNNRCSFLRQNHINLTDVFRRQNAEFSSVTASRTYSIHYALQRYALCVTPMPFCEAYKHKNICLYMKIIFKMRREGMSCYELFRAVTV